MTPPLFFTNACFSIFEKQTHVKLTDQSQEKTRLLFYTQNLVLNITLIIRQVEIDTFVSSNIGLRVSLC